MAIAAILHNTVPDELIFVVIRMTIRAPVVFDRVGHFRFMARFAGYGAVLVFQRECSFGVVEVGDALDRVKGNFIMALRAVLAEFILMRVRMAACTPLVTDAFELLGLNPVFCGHRVAFDAGDLLMLAIEKELCFGMVEQGCGFEGEQEDERVFWW
jgi:hypothetical protein